MLAEHRDGLARQTVRRSWVSVGRGVVAMNKWVCLCFFVWALWGCGSGRVERSATGQTTWGVANSARLSASGAPSAAASASGPVPEVAPAPPKMLGLQSPWSHACIVADKRKPCRIEAFDVAEDGTIVAGGGTYVAAQFGGVSHSLRGTETLVLAAFDPNGKVLWTKSLGKEAHNKISDIQIAGDVIYVVGMHGNGFDLGKHRMPDLPRPPSTPGNDLSFMAETLFVAAYRLDGTLLWAKSAYSLFGLPEQPVTTQNISLGIQSLYPNRHGGVYFVAFGTDPTNAGARILHTVHVVDGKPEASRTYKHDKQLFHLTGESTALDLDGNAYMLVTSLERTNPMRSKDYLMRFGQDGTVRSTLLWEQEFAPERSRPWSVTAYLRMLADGSAIIASKHVHQQLLGRNDPMRSTSHLRVVRVDSKGRVVLDRKLTTPVTHTSDQEEFFDVKTAVVNSAGELVIVLDHHLPVVIDGAMVSPIRQSSVPNKHGLLPGGVTVLRGTFEPGRPISIGVLGPSPCLGVFPGAIQNVRAWRDRLLLIGPVVPESLPNPGCPAFANASSAIASVIEAN